MREHDITRRSFLKFCSLTAAGLGLEPEFAGKIAHALETKPRTPVIWLRGLENAPAVLTELMEHEATYQTGRAAHVLNLTLLPMSDVDHACLDEALGKGPRILSRGYADCRIESTAHRRIWRVRYFNSMDRLILSTLKVVDIPWWGGPPRKTSTTPAAAWRRSWNPIGPAKYPHLGH